MAIENDAVMQVLTHAATKAVVQAIIEERGDETTRHRSEEAGVRPKLGISSPPFNIQKRYRTYEKLIM